MQPVPLRSFNPSHIPLDQLGLEPFDWPAPNQLVDLEIGGGCGLFAVQYGQQNSDRHLISIEKTTKSKQMISRVLQHGLNNVSAIRADAILWTAMNVTKSSLDRVFILYPNPYPKKKQQNLRWAHMPFMSFLLERLKPGGELLLASNLDWYIQDALEGMKTQSCTLIRHQSINQNEPRPRTHFEKKYLQRGQHCQELVFVK